jgi:hypothetical protein
MEHRELTEKIIGCAYHVIKWYLVFLRVFTLLLIGSKNSLQKENLSFVHRKYHEILCSIKVINYLVNPVILSKNS